MAGDSWWDGNSNIPNAVKRLIPLMDFMQYVYEGAYKLADAIPHHPPVYKVPVESKIIGVLGVEGGEQALVQVPVGLVGYDAENKDVLWEVSGIGGEGDLEMPVAAVIPVCLRLLTMLPIDYRTTAAAKSGEANWEAPPDALTMINAAIDAVVSGLLTAAITCFDIAQGNSGNISLSAKLAEWLVSLRHKDLVADAASEAQEVLDQAINFSGIVKQIFGSIPVMDTMQWLHDYAKWMVDQIPHHPSAYTEQIVLSNCVRVVLRLKLGDADTEYDDLPDQDLLKNTTITLLARFYTVSTANLLEPEQVGDDVVIGTWLTADASYTVVATHSGADNPEAVGNPATAWNRFKDMSLIMWNDAIAGQYAVNTHYIHAALIRDIGTAVAPYAEYGTATLVPSGQTHMGSITYDAVSRRVTVTISHRSVKSVVMRTNVVIDFIVALLLLIPITLQRYPEFSWGLLAGGNDA